MAKYVFIFMALALVSYFSGCGKKEKAYDEPMSIDDLSDYMIDLNATAQEQQSPSLEEIPDSTPLAELPPSGPYKPSDRQVQTALKNAGYYTGPVDGKIGPLSKKAIEEFQRANGLKVDGIVGPNTWIALSTFLADKTEPSE